MISIVYVSAATRLLSSEELGDLIHQSRINNETADITGLLLYIDGNFIQAAEGPDDAIDAFQKKLEHDPRHSGMLVLVKEPIAERQFPEWSMGLREAIDVPPEDRQAISAFLHKTKASDGTENSNPSAALSLLNNFRRSMR